MGRVKVTEPVTGVEIEVEDDSPQAKAWGGAKTSKAPTKAEMKAEIERRNEGRDEADLIVPESDMNQDLAAALAADDEAQSNN